MRSKIAYTLLLAIFASIAGFGCTGSGDAPKSGVKIQQGDYANAPGGGAKRPGGPAAGGAPGAG